MEPGLLPGSEADGQLSAARGCVSAVSLSHQHQPSGSGLVAPWTLLTGLVGDCGGVVVKDKAGSWKALHFQPAFL